MARLLVSIEPTPIRIGAIGGELAGPWGVTGDASVAVCFADAGNRRATRGAPAPGTGGGDDGGGAAIATSTCAPSPSGG